MLRLTRFDLFFSFEYSSFGFVWVEGCITFILGYSMGSFSSLACYLILKTWRSVLF